MGGPFLLMKLRAISMTVLKMRSASNTNFILKKRCENGKKTFPDQLWVEFGRLTNWQGSVHQRPKYWGKLVMELIYGYLDADVAAWLKENAPKPVHGQNYH